MTVGQFARGGSDRFCRPSHKGNRLGRAVFQIFNRRGRALGAWGRNLEPPGALVRHRRKGRVMDKDTKHEVAVIALSTLAAIPVIGSLGFVVVAGLLTW